MLWDIYPEELEVLTLHDAYLTLAGDPPSRIPFFVWLFENPRSPLALPGKIDLYQHDCLHLLLKKGFDSFGEAYVLGFAMGNDPNTHWFHLVLFQFVARFLYPSPYCLSQRELEEFKAGVEHGRQVPFKSLNYSNFEFLQAHQLPALRNILGLEYSTYDQGVL